MPFHFGDPRTAPFITLMLAAGLLYAAGRIATFALTRADGSDPGRRAIAQWVPIAGSVLCAICMNRADIALSLILGTSVASLTLAVGMVTWLNPLHVLPPTRKVWPFVLPAALLVLMAGFSAHLAWWHALMLLAFGGAILAVWLEAPEIPEVLDAAPESRPPDGQAAVIMILVIAMIILGGVLAVLGTLKTCAMRDQGRPMLYPGTLAATILSPLLILPTLGTASSVAQRGYPGRAVTALIGTVLLNLCLLLPIAILLWHFRPGLWNGDPSRAFNVRWDRRHTLPFDLAAWQIETVGLVVLGFGLIPIALGRWMLGRLESTLLILAYGGYVVMLAVFGMYQV
jgi:Ca2+/Na+ antiporter